MESGVVPSFWIVDFMEYNLYSKLKTDENLLPAKMLSPKTHSKRNHSRRFMCARIMRIVMDFHGYHQLLSKRDILVGKNQ